MSLKYSFAVGVSTGNFSFVVLLSASSISVSQESSVSVIPVPQGAEAHRDNSMQNQILIKCITSC
jgi:hypothetical protein